MLAQLCLAQIPVKSKSMAKVGLFFGTFNPIHVGHLILANHMAEFTSLEEVWFVVTPRSPFKQKQSLLEDHHRYRMVEEAIQDYDHLKASKIEFNLPQPNYTINTLAYLEEKYGGKHRFALIMGSDNLASFHKWKNYDEILKNHEIFVYPRISDKKPKDAIAGHEHIALIEAPILEISSTFIRKNHKAGKNIRPLLPHSVWQYLDEMNFYR